MSYENDSETSLNVSLDSLNDLYRSGFTAGVKEATEQQDQEFFIQGQLFAYDQILSAFAQNQTSMEMQIVLQYVESLKNRLMATQPKEMDID
jgi:hypothetical protein